MKRLWIFSLLIIGMAVGGHALAEDKAKEEPKAKKSNAGTTVEFVSTGEGDMQVGNDPVIADDPYKGKTVTEADEAGHPLTQKSYGEECKDDLCDRAEKRQTSEGTTWRDDEGKLRKPY